APCALVVFLLVTGHGAIAVHAQEEFEVRVERVEQPHFGSLELEQHFAYVAHGSRMFDGTVAPTQHQFHVASELTFGVNSNASIGVMVLGAARPRGDLEYAGVRLIPHFYAPASWRLPVGLALTAEIGFPDATYENSSFLVELRPTIEKTF